MIEGAESGWAAPTFPVTAVAAKPAILIRTPRRETPHAQPDMQRSKRMAPSVLLVLPLYTGAGCRRLRHRFIFGCSGHITRAKFLKSHRLLEAPLAGHSQFKNIMHRKGRQDAARSKLFSKLAREITVAAKLGTPLPAMNPRLRAAVLAARAENMPKDKIERAIKKSQGGDAENYEEARYEGYGPGGIAVIVEVLTDNRNRTASDVRAVFSRSGGHLAETGAVSFMFDRVGVVAFDASVATADE